MAASDENPGSVESGVGDPELETGSDSKEEEEELEKLEMEVKQMAEKIAKYRATLPDQLRRALETFASTQRPVLDGIYGIESDPGPSGERNNSPGSEGEIGSCGGASISSDEHKVVDKMRMLKEKISSNISTIPLVLKRMKECIAAIDRLDSSNGTIDPAFKRNRTR